MPSLAEMATVTFVYRNPHILAATEFCEKVLQLLSLHLRVLLLNGSVGYGSRSLIDHLIFLLVSSIVVIDFFLVGHS